MLVAVILLLCGILIAIWLTGCGEGRQAVSTVKDVVSGKGASILPAPSKDENKTREQAAVDAASDKVASLSGELAKAKAELEQKEDALKKARYATLRKLSFWLAGISFLATCAAVAAAIFLPVFRNQLLLSAAACASVMILALTVEAALDYLPWIGGIIGAGLITYVILLLVKSRKAIALTAEAGDLFANAITDDEIARIKDLISAKQIKAGVHKLIQDARGKLPK